MASKIHDESKARQLIEFDGMDLGGKILPTDVDALVEYKNIGYLIFEVKHGDKFVPLGQKLALERMVNDFTAHGKLAVAAVCSHNVEDPNTPIVLAECSVRELYRGGNRKWSPPK